MAKAAVASRMKKKPADFKRPKRKVGRKAPQAANVTSVAISSRRINMTEQSVLTDKGDAATTHRHLTLQDLMVQIGHYNAHVRQRALQGLRELAQTHASNVLANVSVVLERFLRTFVDEEAIVRDAALSAWKVLVPVMMEGKSLAPFARLIAMYFCSGLTHLQVGIRQDTLKAISVLLETAPELISVEAGLEQLGRLIENFRDLIAAAQTQGIKVTNSYDLLNATTSNRAAKSRKPSDRSHGDGSVTHHEGGNAVAAKKKKKISSALTLRFSALTVLHKLLFSIDFADDQIGHSDAATLTGQASTSRSTSISMRNAQRSASAHATPVLLLYARPTLVRGNQSERLRHVGFWQEKSRSLLSPLVDLWLECVEGDVLDTLSDEYVENMQRLVETATVILAVNVDHMCEHPGSELHRVAHRIQELMMAQFPMFPAHNLTAGGDAYLSRWYGINVALAKFACVVLRVPETSQRGERHQSLRNRVTTFVMATLTKYATSDELRALSGTHAIVRALLDVLARVLADMADATAREELLAAFTALYLACSPRSVTFRICTAFVIERLADLRCWPSWPLVLQWLTCFGQFLAQLDTSQLTLGRTCLVTLISVMKQLPAEFTQCEATNSVLQNLELFFTLTPLSEEVSQRDTSGFRLHDLEAADQLEFVSLVYHLPRYPVNLLRALASCCKSSRVHVDAKSFLMDILHQRRESLDLAHLVSFLMSGILTSPPTASPTGASVSDVTHQQQQQQQHLQLVRHVCHILRAMNLGASLSKILTPALSRQAAMVSSMSSLELHTLVLLYAACFTSVKPIHRSELPPEMVNDVLSVTSAALLASAGTIDMQTKERALLEQVVSTIVLSDEVMRRTVDGLVAIPPNEARAIAQLRALQFLVQTSVLRAWFVHHHASTVSAVQTIESSGVLSTQDGARVARQLHGDLELVIVGQQSHQ